MADKQLDEYINKTDLDNFETDNVDIQSKKVSLYAFDTDDLTKKKLTGKATDTGFALETSLVDGFSIPVYDEIVLSYTGSDLTGVVYKLATVTVATLTLSYTLGNLTGVIKS